MHITTQVSTAVRPSDFGACSVTELKMLTNTRKRVTKRAIRPRKKSNKSSGQGFGLSSAERKAVEQRAMEVVSKEMKKQGWKVEDVHKEKNRGYDFVFKKQENVMRIN